MKGQSFKFDYDLMWKVSDGVHEDLELETANNCMLSDT